jgi:hypothetical protein
MYALQVLMYLSTTIKKADRSAVKIVVLISGPRSMREKKSEVIVATNMVTTPRPKICKIDVWELKIDWIGKYQPNVRTYMVREAFNAVLFDNPTDI